MENLNYTIKDIARMAGVTAGTVDRVLHNRGDVSPKSREKVQKVLDEIGYQQPNMFAIGLAAKKKYNFICVMPFYIEHDYWDSVATGINRAQKELRPFGRQIFTRNRTGNAGIDRVRPFAGQCRVTEVG